MPQRIDALTVLLPVFNGMPFLSTTVESVLAQTFADFELLVIDDGSTDATAEYLDGLSDPRVRVISRENRGLVATLNEGLSSARHDWVARIDADDVAEPERLERQVAFLEAHPDVGVVSCGGRFLGTHGEAINARVTTQLVSPPLFNPHRDGNILHTGVLYDRRPVVAAGGYRDLVPAEDLDLWLRLYPEVRFAVLDEPLMAVRVRAQGLSSSAAVLQHTMWDYVRACAAARDRGEPEPDREQWTREHTPRGFRRLVVEASPRLRRAGLAWTEGRRVAAVGHGAVAVACNPMLALRKMRGYLRR